MRITTEIPSRHNDDMITVTGTVTATWEGNPSIPNGTRSMVEIDVESAKDESGEAYELTDEEVEMAIDALHEAAYNYEPEPEDI
jgi:hypothetical protein